MGDIVYMYYPNSIRDDYRLARVMDTFPDTKGLVRTVRVGYRRRDKREKPEVYKAKSLTEEIVAVQRLSVLLPVSEQTDSTSVDSTLSKQIPSTVSTSMVNTFSVPSMKHDFNS